MFDPGPLSEYVLSDHARFELFRRGISDFEVGEVIRNPEQIELIRPGRAVYQSRVSVAEGEYVYLMRVFVDFDRQPPIVVTGYRTSKIAKYWRTEG